jgi:ribosome-associated protein
MIEITPDIILDEKDIRYQFSRASGPGGQNVNKVASAVQLRFNVDNPALPPEIRERLIKLAGSRLTTDGTLIIEARRFREQERNRQDALDRLVDLIRRSAQKPKSRRKSRPSQASKTRRLQTKRRRGELKRSRRPVTGADD